MGFGFNLIGFPVLLLTTIALLIYFFVSKKKIALKILRALWGLTILIIITAVISGTNRRPIALTKADIIGDYKVDTNIFSGRNAKWQYDHYRFIITKTDSIYFYATSKDTILKTFKGKLKYSSGPPGLWTISKRQFISCY